MVKERDLARRVRLEVNEWFGALTMVQRGVGLTQGPLACIDQSVFGDLGVATLTGAPQWGWGSPAGTRHSEEPRAGPSSTPLPVEMRVTGGLARTGRDMRRLLIGSGLRRRRACGRARPRAGTGRQHHGHHS